LVRGTNHKVVDRSAIQSVRGANRYLVDRTAI
jgi:hypothetical protein